MSNFFSRLKVENTNIGSIRTDATGVDAAVDYLNTLNNNKVRFEKVSERSPSEALNRGLSDLKRFMLLGQQVIEEVNQEFEQVKNTENGMSTYKNVI